jgi:hypothetical protein
MAAQDETTSGAHITYWNLGMAADESHLASRTLRRMVRQGSRPAAGRNASGPSRRNAAGPSRRNQRIPLIGMNGRFHTPVS